MVVILEMYPHISPIWWGYFDNHTLCKSPSILCYHPIVYLLLLLGKMFCSRIVDKEGFPFFIPIRDNGGSGNLYFSYLKPKNKVFSGFRLVNPNPDFHIFFFYFHLLWVLAKESFKKDFDEFCRF